MKKIFLIIFLSLLVFSSCNAKPRSSSADQTTAVNTSVSELTVWGMTCNNCEKKVTRVVSALDGVINVSVNLRASKVTVEHDLGLDVNAIKKVITSAGYNIP